MSMIKQTKINKLLQKLPPGVVYLSSSLEKMGISLSLQQRYKTNGWFKSIGHGALIRVGENVEWTGALFSLQHYAHLPIHVGARTAINMQGLAHYLELQPKSISLFSPRKVNLPKWFTSYDWDVEVHLYHTNFLPSVSGLNVYDNKNYQISISNPVRALMECLYLAPEKFELVEAYQIMEGLFSLPPFEVQSLLEACGSIKVKRLFLYMAEKANHPWLKYLNLGKIALGSGTRSVVPNGFYEKKYKLILPKEFFEDEI